MQPLQPDAGESPGDSIEASLPLSGGLTDFILPPAPDPGADLQPGARLGDVTILRLVGEGGMGRVYEGLQGMPRRPVAVKVIRPGVLSATSLKRFEYEAQILGRLTHPGIARIYSVGTQRLPGGDVPYFVMEYVEGARPVTVYAADSGLSVRERLVLFREICRAVAHGHQRGVIHRDLKPGNMLVDAAGQAKIIDFGVARSTSGDAALTTVHTHAGHLVGTAQYMSPEQFADAVDGLDVRADVYALGVVLYELLAGRLPYDVAKRPVYAVAHVVQQAEPTPLAKVHPRFRGDVDTIVMKCLEKDRGRRYSSAAELEADLGRHLDGEPISASPPRLSETIARLVRRHRLAALATAAFLTALVVGGVGASIFAVRATRERAAALREKARADAAADVATQRLYLANLRSLAAAIGDRNLRLGRQLHAENVALAGDPPLELRILGARLDEALVVLDWKRGPVGEVEYSPDGRILAAWCLLGETLRSEDDLKRLVHASSLLTSSRGEIVFFGVGGRHDYARLPTPADEWATFWRARSTAWGRRSGDDPVVRPVAVCPAGGRVAVQVSDGRIHIRDATNGSREVVIAGHRGRISGASFSPDGSRLAIGGAAKSLGLWDASNGRLVAMLGDREDRFGAIQFSPDGSRLAAIELRRDRLLAVRIHDAADGRPLATVTTRRADVPTGCLLAFSPDGDHLVAALADDELRVWKVSSGDACASLERASGTVTVLAFSPDGRQVAGGFANGAIRLWNWRTAALEREFLGHDGAVTTLAFHPDGDALASSSVDGTVRIWSRAASAPLASLPDRRGMTAAAFSPDGRRLAVAPLDGGTVELWDPRTVERLHALDVGDGTVAEVAYAPDGAVVAAAVRAGDRAGGVRVWDAESGTLVCALDEIAGGVERVAFSPDGSRLLTTSGGGVAAVWDPRSGRRVSSAAADYRGGFDDVGAVFGLAGKRVGYRIPRLLDAETGAAAAALAQGHVSCLAASPDGRLLAAGMAIGSVTLSDFSTGRVFARLHGHAAPVRAIAFSVDGSRIATGALDGSVCLWDARGGVEPRDPIRAFIGHEAAVEMAVFGPDGCRLVTAARDGTARVWDVETGQQLCVLPAPRDFPRAVALNADGSLLVTADSAGGVLIQGLSNAAVIDARRAAVHAR